MELDLKAKGGTGNEDVSLASSDCMCGLDGQVPGMGLDDLSY